jgi:hypothetical protein
MLRRSFAALGALALIAAVAPASASAARQLDVGLVDPVFASGDGAERQLWQDRASSAGSDAILLTASWASIAPGSKPALFDPRNPADPNYDWGTLDAAISDATERGLRVILTVTGAPAWAEGDNRPGWANQGTWKPKPGALNDFGHAIAQRYSGTFGLLPRVRFFQLWAEPNLGIYLNPQWQGDRPAAPAHYRKMLRGFYGGVKSVSGSNKVLSGGTAPYGDSQPGGTRMQPALFWRSLLCLKGWKLRKAKCRRPAKMDIVAHHPINVGRPNRKAINPNDVSTPDVHKITRIVNKARRTGRILPRKHKPLWATEIWWDSKPPDPGGVPEQRHARWLSESFFVLWKQGVDAVFWFHIRDPQTSDPGATQESGLYLRNGEPKAALRAYRFPFAVHRNGRKVLAWGRAPANGRVLIQSKKGDAWKTEARLRGRAGKVFTRGFRSRADLFRAKVAGGAESVAMPARG